MAGCYVSTKTLDNRGKDDMNETGLAPNSSKIAIKILKNSYPEN